VKKLAEKVGSFANNDLEHIDPKGAEHEKFGFGLKKALLNYMHGACFDHPLQKWFEFKVPKTTVAPDFIRKAIEEPEISNNPNSKIVWLGTDPKTEIIQKSKKGSHWELMSLIFQTKKNTFTINVEPHKGKWLADLLPRISIKNTEQLSLKMVKENYEAAGFDNFELFWDNKPVNTLYKAGLLHL
jgi:hypothetical protein